MQRRHPPAGRAGGAAARCENRVGIAKDTGLRNLPLKSYDAKRIWIAIVQLAADLLAWQALLGMLGHEAAC